MSALNEMNRLALREHAELERQTLGLVQDEALGLERHPEGEESRDPLIIDGVLVTPQPSRIRGKLTVRW